MKTSNQNTSFTLPFTSMYSPFIFEKTFTDFKRYGVDVSDDVTTPKTVRCANDKIFWCFDISEPTSDL